MRVNWVVPTISSLLLIFVKIAVATPPGPTCDLPERLEHEIAKKYPTAKLVNLSDLGADDRGFFQKDHGDACPGLVNVDFYGDGKPTLGVVLITQGREKRKALLVVAHQVRGHWQTALLDTAEATQIPVIWSQPPGRYLDIYGKEEVRATRSAIVFAVYESWAILYAWTGSSATKIWIAD